MSEEKMVVDTVVTTEHSEDVVEEKMRTEEFTISGDQVVEKVKNLVREAKVRRISLRTEDGRTLFDVPMSIGAPVVAAGFFIPPLGIGLVLGAIAGLFLRVKLVVERIED